MWQCRHAVAVMITVPVKPYTLQASKIAVYITAQQRLSGLVVWHPADRKNCPVAGTTTTVVQMRVAHTRCTQTTCSPFQDSQELP